MPTNVLFIIQNLGDGGAQIQLARLALELDRDPEYKVWLAYFEAGSRLSFLVNSDIQTIQLNRQLVMLPFTILKLRRLMRRNRIDILSTWLAGPDVVGGLVVAGTRAKWVIAERNSNYEYRKIFRIRAILGRAANLVIANSAKGAAYWQEVAPQLSRVVIPNIVQAPQAKVESAGQFDVISVGRFVKQKNPILTAQVLAEFAQRNPQARVGMVGQGVMLDEVEAQLEQQGRLTNFSLPGYIPDASAEIASARLLVLLSSHEGQPNVVMEAIMSGTLPVVSRIPEHEELLGADYPFLVDLSSSTSDMVAVVELAYEADPTQHLKFAKAKLSGQTPATITAMYKSEFAKLLG